MGMGISYWPWVSNIDYGYPILAMGILYWLWVSHIDYRYLILTMGILYWPWVFHIDYVYLILTRGNLYRRYKLPLILQYLGKFHHYRTMPRLQTLSFKVKNVLQKFQLWWIADVPQRCYAGIPSELLDNGIERHGVPRVLVTTDSGRTSDALSINDIVRATTTAALLSAIPRARCTRRTRQ